MNGRLLTMRILTENLGWKILSLAIAFLLWAGYVAESEVATSILAPLLLRNAPRDLELSTEVPDRIDLHVRGPESRMSAANLAQANVTLDLAAVTQPGEQTFALTENSVHMPPGVTFVAAVPSQVTVTLDKRVVHEVPVRPRYSGAAPDGYRVSAEQVVPDTIRISGPTSRVETIKFVTTDPIDLSGVVGQKEFRVPVYLPSAYVRCLEAEPVVVRVTVEKADGAQ